MNAFLRNVLTTSFHGSVVILAVLILRLVLRRTPKKYICFLWMLAGLRLLIPVPLQSSFSLQPGMFTIPFDLSGLVPVIWAAIAVVILSYSAVSYIHLRRKVLDAVKVSGGWESDRIETAFVLGFVRPKIYIPTGMSGDTREQILAHERTHLDKGDHWIKMIGFLALALHWFNPLVWLSYVLLCKDIEMACDERVVQFMELEERKAYSAALLQCSTNHVHYAACPVAFGEVSVKYRIQSVLGYRKPGFWISMLGVVSIGFVALCLLTSPVQAEDAEAVRYRTSNLDPADFIPEPMPESEPNPDWGLQLIADVDTLTSGKLVYVMDSSFCENAECVYGENTILERWNGTAWEAVPSLSGTTRFMEDYYLGIGRAAGSFVTYVDLDWKLTYSNLPAGDYRITQDVSSGEQAAVFHVPFRIYRETLPAEQENALLRCEKALETVTNGYWGYSVLISESAPSGNLWPVERISRYRNRARLDFYAGEYEVSSYNGDDAIYAADTWQREFSVGQNRRILFPEGKSKISQDEVTFCSVWVTWDGTECRSTDTYRFAENGNLESVERTSCTPGGQEHTVRLDVGMDQSFFSVDDYIRNLGNYSVEDSHEAQINSPWGLFFRVDDDLLKPTGGEIWLSTNAVGKSSYTTDGSYWLEKSAGDSWEKLPGEATWTEETIRLRSKTYVTMVDWSEVYGSLEPGVYRMGKHFYNGDESMIQYAEFAIMPGGGIYGEGGEEAIARVDAALADCLNRPCRIEKYSTYPNGYAESANLETVIWNYDGVQVNDVYKDGVYQHSYSQTSEDNLFYGEWTRRSYNNDEYDCYYFPEDYSRISDNEIRFVHAFSHNMWSDMTTTYTYCFDDAGRLTEIIRQEKDWGTVRYVITDTPEEEIRAWVEKIKSES